MRQVVEIGPAVEKATAQPVKILSRSYISTHHLWTARHFAALASRIEEAHTGRSIFDPEHRSYVVGAILSSVCFLEAAINEIVQDCEHGHNSYVEHLDEGTIERIAACKKSPRKKERPRALERYRCLVSAIECAPFDEEAEPYIGVLHLVLLRNELTHFHPETRAAEDEHHLDSYLMNRFEWNQMIMTEGNPFFPDRCLGAGCANWSVMAAKGFADQAFERAGIVANYQRVASAPAI